MTDWEIEGDIRYFVNGHGHFPPSIERLTESFFAGRRRTSKRLHDAFLRCCAHILIREGNYVKVKNRIAVGAPVTVTRGTYGYATGGRIDPEHFNCRNYTTQATNNNTTSAASIKIMLETARALGL